MTFSVNKYLSWGYHPTERTCWDLARTVWAELTGVDLGKHVAAETPEVSRSLRRLNEPEDPCLTLFQRKGTDPHVGIYYKGRLLHLNESGAKYVDLSTVASRFRTVTYYGNPC